MYRAEARVRRGHCGHDLGRAPGRRRVIVNTYIYIYIERERCYVYTWGGLRGAVGMALAIRVQIEMAGVGNFASQDCWILLSSSFWLRRLRKSAQ